MTITTDLMLLARQDLAYEAAEHQRAAAEMYPIAHLSRDGDLERTGFPLLDQETGVRRYNDKINHDDIVLWLGDRDNAKVLAVGRRFISVSMGNHITKFDSSKDPPKWIGQISKATYTLHSARGKTT